MRQLWSADGEQMEVWHIYFKKKAQYSFVPMQYDSSQLYLLFPESWDKTPDVYKKEIARRYL